MSIMEHDTQPRSESATHDASVAVVAARPVLRSFEAHYARAAAFASQRRFDDAIVAYRDALAVRPLDLETHLNLGLVLQARGRFDEAIDAYQAATRIAPGVAETQVRLGQALAQKGETTAALAAFERAIALDPLDVRSRLQRAQALRSLGDPTGAQAGFRHALALDPEHVEARAQYSLLLLQMGEREEAAVLLDYPLLLKARQLESVEDWPDMSAFNEALASCVHRHPTLTRDPPAAATRAGSQTLEILDGRERPILALRHVIEQSIRAYLATVPPIARQVFVTPPPAAWSLQGWAVVLRSGGQQLPHFHPAAFLSGVYYVRVPGIVKAGNAGEAGCLKFGRPCAGTAGAAAQAETLTASIRPQEGMIVVFPSYFWHCTVPFESDEERICIAFDVIRPRASGDAGR
jgi:tetratricopeptide (TPR) repeat protein